MGTALTNLSLKLRLPVEGLIRRTVFKQFCGGVSETDCLPTIHKMHEKGVGSVLDYSVEGKEDEETFDVTFHKTMDVIELAKQHKGDGIPIVVFKPTGFGKFDYLPEDY